MSSSDPGATSNAPGWYVWLSVAYLRLIRQAVRRRVLPWRRALRMTASYYVVAPDAGMRSPRPSMRPPPTRGAVGS